MRVLICQMKAGFVVLAAFLPREWGGVGDERRNASILLQCNALKRTKAERTRFFLLGVLYIALKEKYKDALRH